MDRELAQKLKDLGFSDSKLVRQDVVEIDDWFSPTLEELIKACGYKGLKIEGTTDDKEFWACRKDDSELQTGSTIEEAVAKLWLELNKK